MLRNLLLPMAVAYNSEFSARKNSSRVLMHMGGLLFGHYKDGKFCIGGNPIEIVSKTYILH